MCLHTVLVKFTKHVRASIWKPAQLGFDPGAMKPGTMKRTVQTVPAVLPPASCRLV